MVDPRIHDLIQLSNDFMQKKADLSKITSAFYYELFFFRYTLILRLPVSLKKSSMERTEVTVRTVEYAAALPKQSRMTSV